MEQIFGLPQLWPGQAMSGVREIGPGKVTIHDRAR